jgi:hypothetical protein
MGKGELTRQTVIIGNGGSGLDEKKKCRYRRHPLSGDIVVHAKVDTKETLDVWEKAPLVRIGGRLLVEQRLLRVLGSLVPS